MANLNHLPSIKLQCFMKLFLIFQTFCLSTQSNMQYIKFFSDVNCTETNLTGEISDTNTGLNFMPGYGNALRISVNGIWRVDQSLGNLSPGASMSYVVTNDIQCRSKMNGDDAEFYTAERYGNPDLRSSEIYFYNDRSLNEKHFKISASDKEGVIPNQFVVNSWFFTGVSEWTVYLNSNFTGNVTCLKPNERVISDGFGATYERNTQLIIGSVRLGCVSHSSDTISIFANINNFIILLAIVALFNSCYIL